ncbi:rhamnulokinase [metagenome]|uniref:Rhamnulokinase n=1 Tax=metagenome TaxID=256318 RepID=A0A2P2CF80_9ZZZZ
MSDAVASVRVVAVDLGATSGRVMVAEVGPGVLELTEVHRFPNGPVSVEGALRWDVVSIFREVRTGLRLAAAGGTVDGIGIDSWAVDYGLVSPSGSLLGQPFCYRDSRTDGIAERVAQLVGEAEQYDVNGLQQLPFTTINQLVADGPERLAEAGSMLLLPDLLAYWLTGRIGTERTNASTTGLYDVRSGEWATGLAERVGVPPGILAPLRSAGDVVGRLLPEVADELGFQAPVIAVGSHDTASAVVAVPSDRRPSAYISSGTWSLVGLELAHPVLGEAARAADFTNEGGVDGTIRFLKNVMGLWVLSQSVWAWGREGVPDSDLPSLLTAAASVPALRTVIDINDARLLPPGTGPHDSMPARLRALAREAGEPEPRTPAEVVRCILDSLALAYRLQVRRAAALAGVDVEVVHVVGGGANNLMLNQLTADACEVPVYAGPVEASALGNVLVQARALGAALPDLASMRSLIRDTHEIVVYAPRPGLDWAAAADRLAAPGTNPTTSERVT